MSLSNWLEDNILAWLRGTAMPAPPASVYVGLFGSDPTDTGSLTSELSGGGYARVAIAVPAGLSAPADVQGPNAVKNVNQVAFPTATAAWAQANFAALLDAASGGNMLASGALTPSETVASGQRLVLDSNSLVFSID